MPAPAYVETQYTYHQALVTNLEPHPGGGLAFLLRPGIPGAFAAGIQGGPIQ